jgi:hypothetical protein
MSLVTEGRGSFWPLKCREGVAEATYCWNFTEAFTQNLTDRRKSQCNLFFLQDLRESPRFVWRILYSCVGWSRKWIFLLTRNS